MASTRRFLRRLVAFFRPGRADADLAREINSHLQLLEDQFVAQGMTPEDARHRARLAFGGVEQAKEQQREGRSFRLLDYWRLDFILGFRILLKYPGLTVIGGLGMAVAVAIAATAFSVGDTLLHPVLPGDEGHRVVAIQNWDTILIETTTHGDLMLGYGATLLPVVSVFMTLVGLLATLGPARRGLRVPPTEALRES